MAIQSGICLLNNANLLEVQICQLEWVQCWLFLKWRQTIHCTTVALHLISGRTDHVHKLPKAVRAFGEMLILPILSYGAVLLLRIAFRFMICLKWVSQLTNAQIADYYASASSHHETILWPNHIEMSKSFCSSFVDNAAEWTRMHASKCAFKFDTTAIESLKKPNAKSSRIVECHTLSIADGGSWLLSRDDCSVTLLLACGPTPVMELANGFNMSVHCDGTSKWIARLRHLCPGNQLQCALHAKALFDWQSAFIVTLASSITYCVLCYVTPSAFCMHIRRWKRKRMSAESVCIYRIGI